MGANNKPESDVK